MEDLPDGTTRLPHLPGHASERHGPRREGCRGHTTLPSSPAMRGWMRACGGAGGMTQREADIARDLAPRDSESPGVSKKLGLELPPRFGPGARHIERVARPSAFALAAQLGGNLQGVVLRCSTEHRPSYARARDNQILLNALHKLGDKDNTAGGGGASTNTIRRADHIIDVGPSAGNAATAPGGAGAAMRPMAGSQSPQPAYLPRAMRTAAGTPGW